MRRPMAMIRINAGNPGWYDPLTNIHLTITRPTATVYEGANTTNIKNAIRHGLVFVIEGDLDMDSTTLCDVIKEEPKEEVREVAPQVENKTEEITAIKEEVIPAEEVVEVAEEVVEKPKAKKTTKKKTTKKEEAK
ncbi:hypothetical protein [Paraclostridium dentum]|uniref:hypothetical protein n=1 Tax=Paraclostridium dentum TaxID=2662455 RepID=UPI003F2BBCE5